MAGNINRVPVALVSKSSAELTKLMLVNNLQASKEYTYHIVHDGKQWYAWYYEDVTGRITSGR